jgi:hypothetical protein
VTRGWYSGSEEPVGNEFKLNPCKLNGEVVILNRVVMSKRETCASLLSLPPPSSLLMLILLIGPPKAGKELLAQHLCTQHFFTRVHLSPTSPTSNDPNALHFDHSSAFLDHVTRTWRRDYVSTDLHSSLKLQEFSKRPFVAIVAVDAPVGVRFLRAVKE